MSDLLPSSMHVMQADTFAIEGLRRAERPVPQPGPGEILVRLHAATLNYRDLAILTQNYQPTLQAPYVPLSDGSGVVVRRGEGVARFAVGDRVTPVFTQGWRDGKPTATERTRQTLGTPLAGVLAEYVVVPAEDAVHTPPSLTDIEAACLPIAGLTAWTALREGGLKAGDTVLAMGTGGVALFALQFAKAAGARVVLISSSDAKLERGRALGADVTINYRTEPEWEKPVRAATDGRGVDIVVETAGTLQRSLDAVAFGGFVGVVGFVAGYDASIRLRSLIGPMVRVQGIAVGSRAGFEAMNRAIEMHRIKPVVDRVFPIEQSADAFRHLEAGRHFGKVAIDLAPPASR